MMALPSGKHFDLGNGSDLLYFEKFLGVKEACTYLEKLDKEIPWVRPTLSIYGRKCEQPRETCYVADEGLPMYKYSGYQPIVYKWDDFPALKSIADAVHNVLPGCSFNSVLINRYANGNDYAAWHSDDEKVYGSAPTIASVTLGVEREFLLRRKRCNKAVLNDAQEHMSGAKPTQTTCPQSSKETVNALDVLMNKAQLCPNESKRKRCTSRVAEKSVNDLHSFNLKNGSLLVMRGYTQRDWEHSVPKRKKIHGLRINLTFRHIICGR